MKLDYVDKDIQEAVEQTTSAPIYHQAFLNGAAEYRY